MRFTPGDIVIHRDNPSWPEVVTAVYDVEHIETSRQPHVVRAASQFHGTGMRQVLARPRDQMRFGR